MKIKNNTSNKFVSGMGEGVEQKVNVQNSNLITSILRDKIYTDKLRAALIEPLSNAVDEHRKYGIGRPVEVYIENNIIHIRDFAKGLSEEDVYKVFFTYLNSTKNDSDEAIGGFGLGAKAPSAYTDTWYVTSFHDGTKTVYMSSVEGSKGYTRKLQQVACDPNDTGIIVSVPLEKNSKEKALDLLQEAVGFFEFYKKKDIIKLYIVNKIDIDSFSKLSVQEKEKYIFELYTNKFKYNVFYNPNAVYSSFLDGRVTLSRFLSVRTLDTSIYLKAAIYSFYTDKDGNNKPYLISADVDDTYLFSQWFPYSLSGSSATKFAVELSRRSSIYMAVTDGIYFYNIPPEVIDKLKSELPIWLFGRLKNRRGRLLLFVFDKGEFSISPNRESLSLSKVEMRSMVKGITTRLLQAAFDYCRAGWKYFEESVKQNANILPSCFYYAVTLKNDIFFCNILRTVFPPLLEDTYLPAGGFVSAQLLISEEANKASIPYKKEIIKFLDVLYGLSEYGTGIHDYTAADLKLFNNMLTHTPFSCPSLYIDIYNINSLPTRLINFVSSSKLKGRYMLTITSWAGMASLFKDVGAIDITQAMEVLFEDIKVYNSIITKIPQENGINTIVVCDSYNFDLKNSTTGEKINVSINLEDFSVFKALAFAYLNYRDNIKEDNIKKYLSKVDLGDTFEECISLYGDPVALKAEFRSFFFYLCFGSNKSVLFVTEQVLETLKNSIADYFGTNIINDNIKIIKGSEIMENLHTTNEASFNNLLYSLTSIEPWTYLNNSGKEFSVKNSSFSSIEFNTKYLVEGTNTLKSKAYKTKLGNPSEQKNRNNNSNGLEDKYSSILVEVKTEKSCYSAPLSAVFKFNTKKVLVLPLEGSISSYILRAGARHLLGATKDSPWCPENIITSLDTCTTHKSDIIDSLSHILLNTKTYDYVVIFKSDYTKYFYKYVYKDIKGKGWDTIYDLKDEAINSSCLNYIANKKISDFTNNIFSLPGITSKASSNYCCPFYAKSLINIINSYIDSISEKKSSSFPDYKVLLWIGLFSEEAKNKLYKVINSCISKTITKLLSNKTVIRTLILLNFVRPEVSVNEKGEVSLAFYEKIFLAGLLMHSSKDKKEEINIKDLKGEEINAIIKENLPEYKSIVSGINTIINLLKKIMEKNNNFDIEIK